MRGPLQKLKILAIALPLGALLILGASQTANLARRGEAEIAVQDGCAPPSKILHLALEDRNRQRVSGLMLRISPETPLTQLRFNPQPEEMLALRDGMLELRYSARTLQLVTEVQVELCGASPLHEVREAYWTVRELGRPIAKLVDAVSVQWEWRESGRQDVPGTRLLVKELSCMGRPLVQPYQLISEGEPLCVKDPQTLASIEQQMNDLQAERMSFLGKLKALLFGEREYEERLAVLSGSMEKLYLRAPDQGTVMGISYDQQNGLAWIRLRVEESANIRVSP